MSSNNYTEKIIHGAYFPHIDGIRALAVLPVLFYHVYASLCPGGFAGVDVFFVISGYLITGGILRDLRSERFSIQNFYHRRIRRILPAYFVMIAAVFLAGCVFYYSTLLKNLGDASVMGSLFSANFYYLIVGQDYFSPSVKESPLLHLWSLSIEEQFYLFIPLLCFGIWKFRPRWVAPVLSVIAVLSLAGAVQAVGNGKHGAAFYLLHFRAWELLAGSLLAMLPAISSTMLLEQRSRIIALLPWAGLVLVFLPYALLSSSSPFPGLAVLPSVVGTGLLIRYAQMGWVHRFLSSRLLVGVGKISYSLYLWHWPVTVYWKYLTYHQLVVWDYLGMLVLSIGLAYLSWRFVEMPVRISTYWTRPRTFAFATAGIASLVLLGGLTVFNDGWPTFLHTEANALVVPVNQQRPGFLVEEILPRIQQRTKIVEWLIPEKVSAAYNGWTLAYGKSGTRRLGQGSTPEVLLIGDSHAGSLKYGLDQYLRERNMAGIACSMSNTAMYYWDDARTREVRTILEAHPEISKVLIIQAWTSHYKNRRTYPDMSEQLTNFAQKIQTPHRQVYIITDFPGSKTEDTHAKLAMISPRRYLDEWNGTRQKNVYDETLLPIHHMLESVCTESASTLIPLHLAFLDGEEYFGIQHQKGKRVFLYRDSNHLSPDGSVLAVQFIMRYVYPNLPEE